MIQCLTYPRTKWVLAVADISVISRSLHDSSGCQAITFQGEERQEMLD